MSSTERLVLLDVRWKLGGPPGREEYLAGHLPGCGVRGARHRARGAWRAAGRPASAAVDRVAAGRGPAVGHPRRRLGGRVRRQRQPRRGPAWWLLRWAGFDDVRLLDGGLAAWVAAGGALETDDVVPEPGDVTLEGGHVATIDIDGAATYAGVLLDARAAERYAGEVEPIDPKAGHIPGAVSAPTTDNLDVDGRFLPGGRAAPPVRGARRTRGSRRRGLLRIGRHRGARGRGTRDRRLRRCALPRIVVAVEQP